MQSLNDKLPMTTEDQLEKFQKYVTFWLEDELLGVNILDVKEVTPVMAITPIAHSGKEVAGYVNIRGEIHLVIHLRNLLDLEPVEASGTSKIIIFKSNVSEPFGIMVDRIGDVLEINKELIQPYQANQSKNTHSHLFTGVSRLKKNILVLLDAHQLLNPRAPLQATG